MKLNEFKAWFEGFTESMEGAPNKRQWERIKARVEEIDGIAVSYPVYIDRYVQPYYRANPLYWSSTTTISALSSTAQCHNDLSGQNFNGATAMYAAGKAESFNS